MTLGDYVVLTQIAAGPDGVAYRGLEPAEALPVEIRVLSAAKANDRRWPVLAKRLRTAALIAHHSSVRIVEFREDHDPPFVVLDVADAYAGGRTVSVLEGGYNTGALAGCVALHLEGMLARRAPNESA